MICCFLLLLSLNCKIDRISVTASIQKSHFYSFSIETRFNKIRNYFFTPVDQKLWDLRLTFSLQLWYFSASFKWILSSITNKNLEIFAKSQDFYAGLFHKIFWEDLPKTILVNKDSSILIQYIWMMFRPENWFDISNYDTRNLH